MFSRMFKGSLEKLLLGGWEGETSVIRLKVPGIPGPTSAAAGCSSASIPAPCSRGLVPPGCVSGVAQKRSRDGPSAAPGLTGKVSPVRTPPPWPAPRSGVLSGLSSHVSAIFHVSPTGGGHRPALLGEGREGAALPQQSRRLVPSPAQTAAKYGSRYLLLSVRFFFFPLSFCFNIRCSKRSM